MAKKTSAGKTIFKIACATGGAVLASGVGLPWLGAMAGSCLPKVLEGSLGFLVSAVDDDKKQEVLASLLQKPIEQLASLGIEFTGGRIDDFFKSHFEAKESELNFDLPRAVVKVWEEALNKMLRAERDTSTLGLNRDDEFEKARKEFLTFWRQKLRNAQSDNDLLKEFFGEKPDYFLDVEKGKASLIDVLPDQEQVENFFWKRIEESFTNWASIHQSLKDELKQNLFHNFSSALKKELKENERAWKSFEFASSLQTVSMLQSLASNIDQIKDDTSNIKKDLAELNTVLPLIMPKIDTLENTAKEYFKSNQTIIEFLNDFRKDINDKLSEIVQTTRRTDETTQRTESKVGELAKDVKTLLGKKDEEELPKIPDDVKALFDEGNDLRDAGKYEDARITFQKALELASSYKHVLATATAKYYLAVILHEWDKNSAAAKNLLQECLKEVRAIDSETQIARALLFLGEIELHEGNLDQARAYFSQSLEIDKKNDDKRGIAFTLHMLGWLEDHHGDSAKALGLYDQSLTYWLGIYQEGDPKTVMEAAQRVAGEYQHKGLIYENMGNVEETEANYMRSLEWHRKSAFKPDVGKILYILAGLKYREAEYDKGNEFLDEATAIYNEIGDYSWCARCLHLKGQVYFTLRQTDKATAIFESALNAIEKSGDYKEQESYLNTLGDVYLKARKLEQAKEYFERARDLSVREELLDGYVASVKNLSEIAHIKKDNEERNKLLSDGIQTLKKLLLSVQAEPKRAFILGQTGFFYEGLENFDQALVYYQKAEKIYKALSNIHGRAKSMFSIACMKGLLGQTNEAFDTYQEVKKLLDGSPYYDLIADTALNLGIFEMQKENLDEAKRLFQEAEVLCRKYNLPYLPTLQENIERLDALTKARKPPELDFRQLVEELFEWVEWFPEAKNSILRLWMWARMETLLSNYRSTVGVKFILCQDDVDAFLRMSEILHPYSDLKWSNRSGHDTHCKMRV